MKIGVGDGLSSDALGISSRHLDAVAAERHRLPEGVAGRADEVVRSS
jgi:hypothetical protein